MQEQITRLTYSCTYNKIDTQVILIIVIQKKRVMHHGLQMPVCTMVLRLNEKYIYKHEAVTLSFILQEAFSLIFNHIDLNKFQTFIIEILLSVLKLFNVNCVKKYIFRLDLYPNKII